MSTDRMGAALTAVSLIDHALADDREKIADALLPDNPHETLTVLSSTVWCAHFVIGELARQMGVDRAAVVEALRQEVIERFENYNPKGD